MRISNLQCIFDYAGNNSTILHRMDARKRMFLFFLMQIAIYRTGPIMLQLTFLLALSIHIYLRISILNFFRSITYFGIIMILILLMSLNSTAGILQGLQHTALYFQRIITILLYSNIFLSCSTQQSIVQGLRWYTSFLPHRIRTYMSISLGFCFTFLYLCFRESRLINEAMRMRRIRSPLRYIVLFSSALLRNLCNDVDIIHDQLEARNFQANRPLIFSRAGGENFFLCSTACIAIAFIILPL